MIKIIITALCLAIIPSASWSGDKPDYVPKPRSKKDRDPQFVQSQIKAQCPYLVSNVSIYWVDEGHYLAALPQVGMYGPPQEKDDHVEWWLEPFNSDWVPAPPVIAVCFRVKGENVEIPVPPEVRFCYLEKRNSKNPKGDNRRFWCR